MQCHAVGYQAPDDSRHAQIRDLKVLKGDLASVGYVLTAVVGHVSTKHLDLDLLAFRSLDEEFLLSFFLARSHLALVHFLLFHVLLLYCSLDVNAANCHLGVPDKAGTLALACEELI